jgi:hypothetical protein
MKAKKKSVTLKEALTDGRAVANKVSREANVFDICLKPLVSGPPKIQNTYDHGSSPIWNFLARS